MSQFNVTPFQRKALAVTTAVAVLFGTYFLWSYFLLIVLASIVAFTFNPVYQWLLKRLKQNKTAASSITLIITILAIVIPLLIILAITVKEVASAVEYLKGVDIVKAEREFISAVNNILDKLHISYQLSPEVIKESLTKALQTFGTTILKTLASTAGNFFGFFTTAIIYIFVFLSVLLNQDKIISLFKRLNPLGKEVGELYLNRTGAMTKAMVMGQFIIAILQGLIDATLLAIAGLPELFFFFFVFLTALSVIPLGGGIVAIPIGIGMILTGNIWGGLLVIFGHILIVTNIDNVLRPRLVPAQARLDSALTLLAVFSGIKFFGFLGIVIGPVLMILIVSTIQVYLEVFHNLEAVKKDAGTKEKRTLTERAQFWKKSIN